MIFSQRTLAIAFLYVTSYDLRQDVGNRKTNIHIDGRQLDHQQRKGRRIIRRRAEDLNHSFVSRLVTVLEHMKLFLN